MTIDKTRIIRNRLYTIWTNKYQVLKVLTTHSITEFMEHDHVNLDYHQMTREIFETWTSYQIDIKEYSDATIYKHAKKPREFLNWAYPNAYHSHIKYRLQSQEEPVYVTENELNQLISATLKGYLAKTRDPPVFCYYRQIRLA